MQWCRIFYQVPSCFFTFFQFNPTTFPFLMFFIYLYNRGFSDSVRYAFGPLIQTELDTFKDEWNSHTNRNSSMAEAPGGIPNVLYNFPELNGQFCQLMHKYLYQIGVSDYSCDVDENKVRYIKAKFTKEPLIVQQHFKNLADALVVQNNLPAPSNLQNSLELFLSLVTLLETLI